MDSSTRLERALEVFLEWQRTSPPTESAADLLARHSDLEEYLRPLIEDDAATAVDDGPLAADSATWSEAQAADDPRLLGDFRLGAEIGRGGMGVVYAANQLSLGRQIALKVLAPHLTHSPTTIARFRREASTTAKLQHPSIVAVHGFGTIGDVNYLAMELVRGAPLDRVLRSLADRNLTGLNGQHLLSAVREQQVIAPPDNAALGVGTATDDSRTRAIDAPSWHGGYVETIVRLAVQVADALDYAHEHGVIHRDVKPSNILVREDGRAVLTDFGLAREEHLPALTMTGDFAGSPHYVSPEQIAGKPSGIDRRTDVFSLGTTLYELLTGVRPFDAKSSHEILANIATREPADPQSLNSALAPDLAAIVLHALEKSPDRRYQTARAFADDLRSFLAYRPVQARRPGPVARLGRWIRREPLKAGLLVSAIVGLTLALYVVTSREATSTGYAYLQQREVDDLLATGYLRHMTLSEVGFDYFERALAIQPDNPWAIVLGAVAILKRKATADDAGDRDASIVESIEFLDRHAKPPLDQAPAVRRLRAYSKALLAGSDRETIQALRQQFYAPTADALDSFVFGTICMTPAFEESNAGGLEIPREHFMDSILRSHRAEIFPYLELAIAAARIEDPKPSVQIAKALVELWPESAAARFAAGVAHMYHEPKAAIVEFERSIEIDPKFQLAYRNLGSAYSSAGDTERSIHHLKRAIELFPDDATAYSLLSIAFMRSSQIEAAHDAAKRAAELAPDNPVNWSQLGAILERLGEIDAAIEANERAIEIAPHLDRPHRNALGMARKHQTPEHERAEHERWIKMHPNGPTAHWEYARFLLDHGDPVQDLGRAHELAKHAVRVSAAEDPWAMLTLAGVEKRRGDLKEMQRAIAWARRYRPQKPEEAKQFEAELEALEK